MLQLKSIGGRPIVIAGKWIRVAMVHDEEWTAGQVIGEPGQFIENIEDSKIDVDIFTFCQKIPETKPKYPYYFEWNNIAAIPLSNYEDWWKNRLPQETRRNVRLAAKRGVVVTTEELSDKLVAGITEIYNETPIRQGRKFAHYGKDFETIKKELSTLAGSSLFIGAYHGDELIGFIRLILMGPIAGILSIVTKVEHYDKRPTNALINKAVEESVARGAAFLTYNRFTYGNKAEDSLAEFKRRNGFVKMDYPRYYVPLSLKGRIALRLRLHRGALGLVPPPVLGFFVNLRSRMYRSGQPKRAD